MTLRATNPAEEIGLFQVKQDRLNVTLPANIVKKKIEGNKINVQLKVRVKVTLVQALRLCTGCTANRGSRGVALLYRH